MFDCTNQLCTYLAKLCCDVLYGERCCCLCVLQPLGYHHCRTVVSGWQKSENMRSLLSDSVGEEEREKKRRQHLLEKFEVSLAPQSLFTHTHTHTHTHSKSKNMDYGQPGRLIHQLNTTHTHTHTHTHTFSFIHSESNSTFSLIHTVTESNSLPLISEGPGCIGCPASQKEDIQ